MKTLFSVLAIFLVTNTTSYGQGFGGGGMGGAGSGTYRSQYRYSTNTVHSQSQQDSRNDTERTGATGTAVISVKPESLRLVFAVTADEETSQSCAASIKTAIEKIRNSDVASKIGAENIVEDFINVEAKYTWRPHDLKVKNDSDVSEAEGEDQEKGEGEAKGNSFEQALRVKDEDEDNTERFLLEIPDGYRMQTNLHVLCKDEQQALDVMDAAFEAGVNDIISFDYWHSDIDKYKKEALKLAIEEAKAKANVLLSVFDEKPKLLNVHSGSTILYPETLYRTIENDAKNSMPSVPRTWRDYAKISSFRPKTTFYAGPKGYHDRSPARPAMHPEIAVSSSVTLTYGTPARDQRIELEKLKISSEAKSENSSE